MKRNQKKKENIEDPQMMINNTVCKQLNQQK